MYIYGSRHEVLVASLMEIQFMYYVKARGVRYIYILVLIIEPKGLGQRFEERRRGRPADVLNIIQKRQNHRNGCSPESGTRRFLAHGISLRVERLQTINIENVRMLYTW